MTIEDYEERLKIEQLYYKYRNLIYKVSYNILQDKYMAEDAISETFERVKKKYIELMKLIVLKSETFWLLYAESF